MLVYCHVYSLSYEAGTGIIIELRESISLPKSKYKGLVHTFECIMLKKIIAIWI